MINCDDSNNCDEYADDSTFMTEEGELGCYGEFIRQPAKSDLNFKN